MALPAHVIRDLPKLRWRGLSAPMESAPVDFAHAQAERKAYGIDGAWHDHGGREPLTIKVRLHFINTLFGGILWFPNEYNKWQKALFDGSPGKLRHPILGEFDAVVLNGSVDFTARQLGGVSVDVTFVETLLDVTKPTELKTLEVDVKALTKQVLNDAGNLGINFPSGILSSDLGDAINSLLGSIASAQMTVSGYANQIVGGIEDMIERVELLADPAVAPVYDNLVHLWDTMRTRAAELEKLSARSTQKRTLDVDSTFDALATKYGNSVEDLMNLNPQLVKFRVVPKGQIVTFYTDK